MRHPFAQLCLAVLFMLYGELWQKHVHNVAVNAEDLCPHSMSNVKLLPAAQIRSGRCT